MIEIIPIRRNTLIYDQARTLLEDTWPDNYPGEDAKSEIDRLIDTGMLFGAVEETALLGFIGAVAEYGTTGYELHPLIVDVDHRRKGIGRMLVHYLENMVRKEGGIILYLGTDDETFSTSLSEGDLFENTFEKIRNIQNTGHHPYSFYEKLDFRIVGVLPDVNGFHKPDIFMAKRLVELPE